MAAIVAPHAGVVRCSVSNALTNQSQRVSSGNGKRIGSRVCLSRGDFIGAAIPCKNLAGRGSHCRITCTATLSGPSVDTSSDSIIKRLELMADVDARRLKAETNPLENLQFSYDDFVDALSKYETDFSFDIGEIVRGVIFNTDKGGALVDIGAKAPAFLPLPEACIYRVKNLEDIGLVPGVQEEFMILEEDTRQGRLVLSLKKLQYDIAWERCRQLQADDVTVRGKVLDVNKGGILVLVEGLRGFVPTSHVAVRFAKEELIHKEIPFKFLEVDEERTRLVLSNRRAMTENQIQTFGVGDVVVGTVQAVKPYGAFIDIGGINGLLHISQISHDRITDVESVLNEGDKLKVMILSHDRDRGRISLSTKKLEPTPGDMLRNPQLVFEKAEEMAKTFRERVAQAEASARAEEKLLQEQGYKLRMDLTTEGGGDLFGLESLSLDDIPAAEDP